MPGVNGIVMGNNGIPIRIGDAVEHMHQDVADRMRREPVQKVDHDGFRPSKFEPVFTPQPYDSRANLDYGASGNKMKSSWGVESVTPPLHLIEPNGILGSERMYPRKLRKCDVFWVDMPGHQTSPIYPLSRSELDDSAGVYNLRIGPLVQRIDASHGDLHLNQGIVGLSPRQERDLFGGRTGRDHYQDFHRRDL